MLVMWGGLAMCCGLIGEAEGCRAERVRSEMAPRFTRSFYGVQV